MNLLKEIIKIIFKRKYFSFLVNLFYKFEHKFLTMTRNQINLKTNL